MYFSWGINRTLQILFSFNLCIFQEMHGKEKEMLESEAKEKVAKRSTCLEKVWQIQIQIQKEAKRAPAWKRFDKYKYKYKICGIKPNTQQRCPKKAMENENLVWHKKKRKLSLPVLLYHQAKELRSQLKLWKKQRRKRPARVFSTFYNQAIYCPFYLWPFLFHI